LLQLLKPIVKLLKLLSHIISKQNELVSKLHQNISNVAIAWIVWNLHDFVSALNLAKLIPSKD